MKINKFKIIVVMFSLLVTSCLDMFAEWQRDNLSNTGCYDFVYSLCFDQLGNMVAYTNSDFQIRDKNDNWSVTPFTDSVVAKSDSYMKYGIASPDGKFYFCADKGLYSIENGVFKQEYMNFRQQAREIECTEDGAIWVAMDDSLVYKYKDNRIIDSVNWKALGDPHPTYYFQEIALDYVGRLWRVNFDKLYMLDTNKKLIIFDSTNSPFNQRFKPEFLSRNDNREIFVTTYASTLFVNRVNGEWDVFRFDTLNPEIFGKRWRIMSNAADKITGDIVFFAINMDNTSDRGLFRYNKEHKLVKHYPNPSIIEIDTSSCGIKYHPIDIDFDTDGKLYVVYNYVVEKFTEDGVWVKDELKETQDDFLEFAQISPNPILSKGIVKFYTNPCNSERIKFSLYDFYGHKVGDLHGEIKIDTNTGNGEIEIDAEQFCAGAYILTASLGERSYSTKVIIQK